MVPADIVTFRHHWWFFLLRGLAATAFGVLTLMWPGATLIVLMAFIAAYAVIDGAVALAYALRLRSSFPHWWVLLIQGLISVAFGVLVYFYPGLSLIYIVVSVALWMALASVTQFMLGRVQKAMGAPSGWSLVGAVLSLALGVAAVVFPRLTVVAVLALIAWFALAVGVVQLVVAVQARSFARALAAGT